MIALLLDEYMQPSWLHVLFLPILAKILPKHLNTYQELTYADIKG